MGKMVNSDDLAGIAEIVAATGESKSTVSMWASGRSDNGFPEAVAELASGRLWKLSQVLSWYRAYEPARGVRNPPVLTA